MTPAPSHATIRGLCAGYFLWWVLGTLEGFSKVMSSWFGVKMPPSIPLGFLGMFLFGPGISLLLTLTGVFAGIQLLRDRPKAPLFALFVAWAALVWQLVLNGRSLQILLTANIPKKVSGTFNLEVLLRQSLVTMAPLIVLIILLLRLHRANRPATPLPLGDEQTA